MKDFAFDVPVHCGFPSPIRTAGEAVLLLNSHLQARFSIAGLNTLLMLERAGEGTDVREARIAFSAWAFNEQLLAPN